MYEGKIFSLSSVKAIELLFMWREGGTSPIIGPKISKSENKYRIFLFLLYNRCSKQNYIKIGHKRLKFGQKKYTHI